jgi:hypothetical protein
MNKWSSSDVVAVILSGVMIIAILGHIAHWLIYPEHDSNLKHADYWGRVYLTLIGGLLLFIGIRTKK